jgi:hypothetical protein
MNSFFFWHMYRTEYNARTSVKGISEPENSDVSRNYFNSFFPNRVNELFVLGARNNTSGRRIDLLITEQHVEEFLLLTVKNVMRIYVYYRSIIN